MSKKGKLVLAPVFLILFTLFSYLVAKERFISLDFDTTVRIQDAIAKLDIQRFEGLLEDIGIFASPTISVAIVLVVTTVSLKRYKLKALIIPITFIVMTLAEIYGKSVVHHPAPPFFMLKNPTTIFPTYHVWEEFSYPSGHAARAIFIAITSFFLFRKRIWVGAALISYVFLIALSRIYLGHHWFSDIAGGSFLGLAFAFMSLVFL